MFAISDEELSECPSLPDKIWCTRCGVEHAISRGKSFVFENGQKVYKDSSRLSLQYMRCGGMVLLVGINGRDIRKAK